MGTLRGPANTVGKHMKADPGLPRTATGWSSCHTRHLPGPARVAPGAIMVLWARGFLGQPHGSRRGLVSRNLNAPAVGAEGGQRQLTL